MFSNIASSSISFGIGCIILALFVRVIASWFGFDERIAFIRFLARFTDPFLDPVRRIVRPVGVLDLSFLIVTFLLITLRALLVQALPPNW